MDNKIKKEHYKLIVMKLKELCNESEKDVDIAYSKMALNEEINDIKDTISDFEKEVANLEIQLSEKETNLYVLGVLIDAYNNVFASESNILRNELTDENDDLSEIFIEVDEFLENAEERLDSFIKYDLGLGGIYEYFGDTNFTEEGYIELQKNECPVCEEINDIKDTIESKEYEIYKLQERITELESTEKL